MSGGTRDVPPRRRLTGWGRTSPSVASLVQASSVDDVRAAVRGAGARGVLARGLGRSYGDAAQNAGGVVVDLTGLDRVLAIHAEDATVLVEAGVSLDTLMRVLLPLGLWVPVLPGTRHVTVGGAIAADVHGKNHHRVGSFGHHLRELWLVTADGQEHRLGPEEPLFRATVGGMGLTGVITRARLGLTRVETAYVSVTTERTPDLDATTRLLATADDPYTVAWFDASHPRRAGRGVVERARHASLDDLPAGARSRPLALPEGRTWSVPDVVPRSLVTPTSVRAFSEMWFRRAPRRREDRVLTASSFFHPLDGVGGWNRVYGPRGFCQYQFVVPPEATTAVRECVDLVVGSGHTSFLNVLKRLGPGSGGLLSFPTPGWTLAVDLAVRDGLEELLEELDARVLAAGGRLYLAKDARMSEQTLRASYPHLDDFRRIRREADPGGVFRSDLARRLDL